MKKIKTLALAATTLLVVSCGVGTTSGTSSQSGSILGAVLNDVLQGGTISNVITSVIGAQTVTRADLIAAWKYTSPGCAFTSENLLAKAGGEVAAAQIRTKIQPYYQQIGINSSNTFITFNEDGTFSAQFRGTPWSGKWVFDEKTYKVTLQGMLLNVNCYAKRNANGVGLLFEGKKLLTLLQTIAAMSGNQNIQAVGEISKSYDGVRLGFDFSK
jgi:hypothetical protein